MIYMYINTKSCTVYFEDMIISYVYLFSYRILEKEIKTVINVII